ncbi:MAG: hypothetical protein JNK71_05060 [Methyloversatilis sp.]|nr:hypothetical protein [Methyloversatilis sp.]
MTGPSLMAFRPTALAALAALAFGVSTAAGAADPLDDLFIDTPAADAPAAKEGAAAGLPDLGEAKSTVSGWKGYSQFELARTVAGDSHWSKARWRNELGRSGRFGQGIKWKAVGRVDYDFAYGWEDDFYPANVRDDKRSEFAWREVYVDVPLGNMELRLGRQHIVWGEMVGLFFADVVSAKDAREFFNPEFEQLRIPQWAARAEYFMGDVHAEFVWVPYVSVDNIGRFGGDYYPVQPEIPGLAPVYNAQVRPDRKLSNSNYGLRVSTLLKGWDLSAFYYRSIDVNPTFSRQIAGPTVFYTPEHDWIHQYGGTLSKDFGKFLLRAESVLTLDRRVPVTSNVADGLVKQNMVDYAIGLDFPLENEARFNVQYFERYHMDRPRDLLLSRRENGFTMLYHHKFADRLEGEMLWVQSLVRNDYMVRPKLIWKMQPNWRALLGADLFGGTNNGLFGRFGDSDRYYGELRYSF